MASKIPIEMILTGHGCSWRGPLIGRAVQEYALFAANKQMGKKVTIIFDSMHGATEKAAQALAGGC